MALTVGELNAILTVDDRAVDPALRRTEQAMRQAGRRIGSDAENAGQQAGQQLGGGFVRGADGQWRNMRGELVDAVRAATLEAEAQAHRGGQQAGQQFGSGLTDGAAAGADAAVGESESRLSKLKTAALGIGAAAGAILMDAFGQAMDQTKISGRLAAQLGATGTDAQRYGHIAGQLYANAVTEDFQGAADAIGAVMGAGLVDPTATNSQIQSIATKVSDLATTFDQDLGGVVNAVSQMIRTGLAKNSTDALDILTKGFQSSANKAGDLLDTFNEYGTQFRKAGLDGATAVGLMNQAIQAGARDSDIAADAIKEFSLRAINGSKLTAQGFGALGLNADQMAKKFSKGGKSATSALDTTLDRLRNMKDPIKQSAAATALFGTQSEDLGAALYAMDPSKAVDGIGKVGGAADKMGASLRDNASTQVEQFKRKAMQGLVDFLASTVIPRLTTFFSFVQDHSTAFKIAAIGVAALGTAFSIAAIGVWAFNSAMLANPVFWIVAGILLVIAGAVLLITTYWDQIKSATLTAWDWVVGKISYAVGAVMTAIGYLKALPGLISGWFKQMASATAAVIASWVTWVAGIPGRVWGAIAGLAGVLQSAATKAFNAFRSAAVTKVVAFLGYVKGIPSRVTGAIGAVSGLLYTKGTQIVQGLWSGIVSMGGWLRSKLIGWAKSAIPGPIAKALGIASPSKVTKAQGRWIARGLVDGLTGSSKQVKSASTKLADIIRDGLNPGKKRSKALGTLSSGTKKLLKLASQEDKLAARMKTATKKIADQIKARDKLAADVKKGVLDSANITSQDNTGGWPQTAETILAGLKQDRAAADLFAKNLATLRKKGVRADLIAQIAQAGVEQGSSAAAALAGANKEQIKSINKEQGALVAAAGNAGTTAGNAMYGAGIAAGQGLVKGLQKQQKAIEAQMLKIAKGMSKSIRKALGIKSPSKVMAQVGAYTAHGLIKGVEGERKAVNRSMASLVETPTAGSFDSASARARAVASQRVVLELRSSGRPEDDYLVERMRRGIRRKGGTDANFVLTGRRSG